MPPALSICRVLSFFFGQNGQSPTALFYRDHRVLPTWLSITRMNERERLAALGASLCFSPCHETTPANRFAFKNRPVVCLFIQTGFRMVVWGEILCAMDQHQLAPNVQEPGCRPLLQLALHHGENKKENGEAGGIRVIIRAMENHQWVLPTFTRTDVPGFVHFGQKIMTPRMRSGDSGGM